MGADWGLYSALRGQDNWAQKRQDKMDNLMMLERREKKAEDNLAKEAQLEQGMQQYFDEISKLDALAEDQGRIQEEEKNARRNIYKGIAAVNGNLKAYMSTGGISALSEYKRTVLGSEAVKNAALNKVNMSNFIKDRSEGKYIKKVNVEIPVMDGDKPKLDKNGNPITRTEEVTVEKEIELFQDGIIKKINYNGSERKVKLDPLKFSKTTKNPNDPYNAAVVTTDDVYAYAVEQGASPEYAKKVAVEYGKAKVKSGQPWYWGKDDQYADMEKAAKAAKYSSSSSGGAGGVRKLNQTSAKLQRASSEARTRGEDIQEELGPKEMKFWKDKWGISHNNKTRANTSSNKSLEAIDPITKKPVTLNNALDVSISDKYVVYPDGRKFIQANVTYSADEPIEGNPHRESTVFSINELNPNASRNNWQWLNADETDFNYENMSGISSSTDLVSGTVLIEITKTMANQTVVDQINQYVNITNKYDNAAGGITGRDNDQSVMNSESEIKAEIKRNNPLFTEDEVNQSYALNLISNQNKED